MDIIDLLSARIDSVTAHNIINKSPADNPAPVVHRLTDIDAQPLTWLWPGWIPASVLTILGGHVGDGKSTVIAAIVAALTAGKTLPDGFTPDPANVLILSAEDDPARVIRPRLEANGADLDRVFIVDGANGTGDGRRQPDLRRDADHLRDIIEDRDIQLLVIDPLSSFLLRSDRASEGAVRDALHPLMDVITETGVAILGVMRVGKRGKNRQPAQRLVGSSAVPAIARSVIMVANTPGNEDEQDRLILQVVKSNYTRAPHPISLQMMDDSAVHWLGPASAGIDEVAETAIDRRLTKSEREDAADFLREYLKEGSETARSVLIQGKALGFSEITIRRAKKDAGVCSFRDAAAFGTWTWCLPDSPDAPTGPIRPHVAK